MTTRRVSPGLSVPPNWPVPPDSPAPPHAVDTGLVTLRNCWRGVYSLIHKRENPHRRSPLNPTSPLHAHPIASRLLGGVKRLVG